jgi:hypothetical protein
MGARLRAYCPIHGSDHKRSLSIALEGPNRGMGKCHACQAVVRVIELYGKKEWPGAKRDAPIAYPAVDEDGTVLGRHMRQDFRNADGEPDKRMWWEDLEGRKVADMPLWVLMDLLEAKEAARAAGTRLTVILCEGERKVDAANRAIAREGIQHLLAVGTMTGSAAIPCDDRLRPLLGCTVRLWPDNDAPKKRLPARRGRRAYGGHQRAAGGAGSRCARVGHLARRAAQG